MSEDATAPESAAPKSLNPTEAKRLSREWRRASDTRLALLFEYVKGPYNIGAMLRTAASLRVDKIYAVGLDQGWGDAKVQKTALGTHRYIDREQYETIGEAAAAAREDGFRLVGLELATTAKPLWDTDMTSDTCIVVGHEDKGVSPAMMRLCDDIAYIPMLGKVGSLNVATAASMAMFEARRQALSAEGPSTTDPTALAEFIASERAASSDD